MVFFQEMLIVGKLLCYKTLHDMLLQEENPFLTGSANSDSAHQPAADYFPNTAQHTLFIDPRLVYISVCVCVYSTRDLCSLLQTCFTQATTLQIPPCINLTGISK